MRRAAFLVALTLFPGCPGQPADESSEPGLEPPPSVAPEFTLPELTGATVSLSSLRGRTVILDFWATWCAPCVKQIPVLNRFHARHRDDGIALYGVAVDAEGSEVVAPFVSAEAVQYPILLGTETLARSYGAIGYPTLFVIDPAGRIVSVHIGVVDAEDLEAAVAAAR